MLGRVPAPERLTIAQVTPHPWGARHEINEFAGRVSVGARRARPPGRDRRPVGLARPRCASRAGDRRRQGPPGLAASAAASLGCWRSAPGSRCRAVRARGRRRCRSTSAARSRGCSAGSTSTSSTSTTRSRPASPRRRCATRARSTSAASTSPASGSSRPRWRGRWSRSSSAGSTRAPPAAATTESLMERFFPGPYERVEPGADARRRALVAGRRGRRRAPAADRLLPRRGARRPAAVPARDPPARSRRRLGGGGLGRRPGRGPDRAASARPGPRRSVPRECSAEALIAGADVLVAASGGPRPAPGTGPRGARHRDRPGLLADPALQRADSRRRARARCSSRATRSRSPASSSACSASPALRRELRGQGAGRGSRLGRGRRPGRGDLPADLRAPPRPARQPRGPPPDRSPARDPRRPAHAHRPLVRLRDAGRDPAGDRPRRRPRRDRDHRPQRGLGRVRGAPRSRTSSGSR